MDLWILHSHQPKDHQSEKEQKRRTAGKQESIEPGTPKKIQNLRQKDNAKINSPPVLFVESVCHGCAKQTMQNDLNDWSARVGLSPNPRCSSEAVLVSQDCLTLC